MTYSLTSSPAAKIFPSLWCLKYKSFLLNQLQNNQKKAWFITSLGQQEDINLYETVSL